jgi:hypothetical protein
MATRHTPPAPVQVGGTAFSVFLDSLQDGLHTKFFLDNDSALQGRYRLTGLSDPRAHGQEHPVWIRSNECARGRSRRGCAAGRDYADRARPLAMMEGRKMQMKIGRIRRHWLSVGSYHKLKGKVEAFSHLVSRILRAKPLFFWPKRASFCINLGNAAKCRHIIRTLYNIAVII